MNSSLPNVGPRSAAPVALFIHARGDHLRRTVAALVANHGASETDLHIFADAARHDGERAAVEDARQFAKEIKGFKSVRVVERERNFGLAQNIIQGIGELFEHHDRVIVVEDDLVTSPHFLRFMNDALERYRDDDRVWHINGWTYPIATQTDDRPFFTPIMECWGWGTWRNRWAKFERNPDRYLGRWDAHRIARFNLRGGYDYWGDLKRNAAGIMNTWGVFWYAAIFDQDGLCLSPAKSMVINIGIDGSGTNSGGRNIFRDVALSELMPNRWPDDVTADVAAHDAICEFLLSCRPPLWLRLASRMKWSLRQLRHSLLQRL